MVNFSARQIPAKIFSDIHGQKVANLNEISPKIFKAQAEIFNETEKVLSHFLRLLCYSKVSFFAPSESMATGELTKVLGMKFYGQPPRLRFFIW